MKRYHLLAAITAVGGALAASALLGWPRESGYRLGWILLMALGGVFGLRFFNSPDRRAKWCFGIAGGLFVLAAALGARLEAVDETGWDGLALSVLCGALWGPAVGGVLHGIALWLEKQPLSAKHPKRVFWLVWGILLLCWLPVIIAYFPGITGYDMDAQIYQLTSGNYNAHHPILHTLLIALFYHLLGPTIGYGVHTVLQAVLLAASIAYALSWLRGTGCPKWLWMVLLAFFALSPQHSIMAVSGTKDILFAAAMLVIAVEWIRLFSEPERSRKPMVIAFLILMMALAGMLRNNAVHGFAAVVVPMVVFRKKIGKRAVVLMLAGMLAAVGCTETMNRLTNAVGTSVREKMSIPCQQLARVYYKYGTSIPVGYEIPELLPDAENYKPDRSDYTKRSAKVTTNDRLVRFVKLWLRESVNHPIEYIDAVLLNTKGFWYLGDNTFATTYDEKEGSQIGCMVLKHVDTLGIDAPWMLPGVRELCSRLFAHNEYRAFTPGWMLLHPALYTWLLVFMISWSIWRKQSGTLVSLGVLTCYLLTLFLGPCAIIRYQYFLMLAAPVVLAFLCVSARRTEVEA